MAMSSPIRARWVLCALSAALLAACGDTAKHPIEDGMGPDPVLPDPVKRMIPTVKIAEVKRWADGAASGARRRPGGAGLRP